LPKAIGGYGFSLTTISYLYFTPLVALFIGEVRLAVLSIKEDRALLERALTLDLPL